MHLRPTERLNIPRTKMSTKRSTKWKIMEERLEQVSLWLLASVMEVGIKAWRTRHLPTGRLPHQSLPGIEKIIVPPDDGDVVGQTGDLIAFKAVLLGSKETISAGTSFASKSFMLRQASNIKSSRHTSSSADIDIGTSSYFEVCLFFRSGNSSLG